jgi:hypothetical protein
MSAPTLDEIRFHRLPKAFNPSGPVTEYDMLKERQKGTSKNLRRSLTAYGICNRIGSVQHS